MSGYVPGSNRNLRVLSLDDFETILYNNPEFSAKLLAKFLLSENEVSRSLYNILLNHQLTSATATPRPVYSNMSRHEHSASGTRDQLAYSQLDDNNNYYYEINDNNLYGNGASLSSHVVEEPWSTTSFQQRKRVPLYERKSVLQPTTSMSRTDNNVQSALGSVATSLNPNQLGSPVTPYVESAHSERTEGVASNYTAAYNIPQKQYLLLEEIPLYYVSDDAGAAASEPNTLYPQEPVKLYRVVRVSDINHSQQYRAQSGLGYRQTVSADSCFIDKVTKTRMTANTLESVQSAAPTRQASLDFDFSTSSQQSEMLSLSSGSASSCFIPKETKGFTMAETLASTEQASVDIGLPLLPQQRQQQQQQQQQQMGDMLYLPSRKTDSTEFFMKPKDTKKNHTTDEISEKKGLSLLPKDIVEMLFLPDRDSPNAGESCNASEDVEGASALPYPAIVTNNLPASNLNSIERPKASKFGDACAIKYLHPILGAANNKTTMNNRASVFVPSSDRMKINARVSNGQEISFCRFCKNNKESSDFYNSHVLKDHNGNVTCPILFNYTCTFCGATGRLAHTDSHCSKNPNKGISVYKSNPW